MPIEFKPKDILEEYKLELDFEALGINNIFISTTKYIQVKGNQIIFLNEDKKVLGMTNFENQEKAVNFFNFVAFILDYKIIFKDKFAILQAKLE